MAHPQFSIGIDLGTTNCALAFEGLGTPSRHVRCCSSRNGKLPPDFRRRQHCLPFFISFEDEAGQISNHRTLRAEWVPGRIARTRAAESPGRVVHSAKSWLCHHGVDRTASFLPWRSDEIAGRKANLAHPRFCAATGIPPRSVGRQVRRPGLPFDDQEITITVPASFDAAAQKLTLEAAREAGFPVGVRLLEEPQAAFYWWLEEGVGEIDGSRDSLKRALNTFWSSTSEVAPPISLSLRSPPAPKHRFRGSSESP